MSEAFHVSTLYVLRNVDNTPVYYSRVKLFIQPLSSNFYEPTKETLFWRQRKYPLIRFVACVQINFLTFGVSVMISNHTQKWCGGPIKPTLKLVLAQNLSVENKELVLGHAIQPALEPLWWNRGNRRC